jgi:hypothetical protein
VDVWWPASGTKQHFADVAANRAYSLEEGASTLTPLARTPVALGGARRPK